ncbi:MAG: FecR domain-containing protein [Steroidobacteraceae bacterium]
MEKETDLVESLIRNAGRREQPPEDAYRQVHAAATAAFRAKTTRRRERMWVLWAGAAAVTVFAIALMFQWAPPSAERTELARIVRVIGSAEQATGDVWQPLGETSIPLSVGLKLRTLAGGRASLMLAGGASLRLAADTEVMLDAPGRLYVRQGTIYVDSGAPPGVSRLEIVTPAGTARDLGTQFELHVAGVALRLRVREGMVAIDRGGRSVTGNAGEQIAFDVFGSVSRDFIEPDAVEWQWAEAIAPTPDVDGKPAAVLIAWAARETGRRLRYVSPGVEQRAATVILHGNIRSLAPLAALDAMLATTDLEYALQGDTMEIRARDTPPLDP